MMLKKLLFLIILIASIILTGVSSALSENVDPMTGINSGLLLVKSMSTRYFPQLYPDTLYIGPIYSWFPREYLNLYTDETMDKILIDLKWRLDNNWYLGIYSEIEHKEENYWNENNLQVENTMDMDIGIIFIHKF